MTRRSATVFGRPGISALCSATSSASTCAVRTGAASETRTPTHAMTSMNRSVVKAMERGMVWPGSVSCGGERVKVGRIAIAGRFGILAASRPTSLSSDRVGRQTLPAIRRKAGAVSSEPDPARVASGVRAPAYRRSPATRDTAVCDKVQGAGAARVASGVQAPGNRRQPAKVRLQFTYKVRRAGESDRRPGKFKRTVLHGSFSGVDGRGRAWRDRRQNTAPRVDARRSPAPTRANYSGHRSRDARQPYAGRPGRRMDTRNRAGDVSAMAAGAFVSAGRIVGAESG